MATGWLRERKARLRTRPDGGYEPRGPDLEEGHWRSAISRKTSQDIWISAAALVGDRPLAIGERSPVKFKTREDGDSSPTDSDSFRSFGEPYYKDSRRPSHLTNSSNASNPGGRTRSYGRRVSSLSEYSLGSSPRTAPPSRRQSRRPSVAGQLAGPAPMRVAHVVSHRRSSRVQARRLSTLGSTVMRFQTEHSLNPVSIGGRLFDFVMRCRKSPLFTSDWVALQLNELCRRDLFLEYDASHRNCEAVASMLQDALYLEIMRHITPEIKARPANLRGFKRVKPSRFVEVVRLIVAQKREAKSLKAEVTTWDRRQAQLNLHRRKEDGPSTRFKKLEKVVGFWLDYKGHAWDSWTEEAASPLGPQGGKLLKLPGSASSPVLPSTPSPMSPDSVTPDFSPGGLFRRLPPLTAGPTPRAEGPPERAQTPNSSRRPGSSQSKNARFLLGGGLATEPRPSSSQKSLKPGADRLPPVVARVKYLGACESSQVTPKTLTFVTGHSTKLSAAGRNLLDLDLLAVTDTLPSTVIDDVDLCDCKSLSDKSLVPFLGGLVKSRAKKTLRRLILRHCVRAALGTQSMIVEVLHIIEGLRHLDVSHVQFARKYHWPLCEAIREHAYLETALLSDIGLGCSPQTKDCIAALGMSKLRTMDISWNSFNSEEFMCFAEKMRDNDWIWDLNLCNATGQWQISPTGPINPIAFFLEQLGYVTPLRRLNLAMNGIDHESMLVLEDALESHKQLTSLDLSNNGLGVLGMRSLMRLMSQDLCGLVHLNIAEAYHGPCPHEDIVQIFRATNPGGRYSFNLAGPYHRAFLRMLYKSCERFNITPEQAFQNVVYSNGSYKHPSKDSQGFRLVPKDGTIALTFNMERAIEAAVQGVPDEDFPGFLRRHYEITRFKPPFEKMVPIISAWRGLNGLESVQEIVLQALSRDFSLSLAHIEAFAESCKARSDEVVGNLVASLPLGDEVQQFMAGLIFPSCRLYLTAHSRTRKMSDLNLENPTGHYCLDLSESSQFAVAQHLMLLDRWEVLVDKRRHRFDISSRGTRSHLRNELYRSFPLLWVCETVAEWNLPEVGVFEFDYSSSVRPPPVAEVLSDANFDIVLTELSDSTAPPDCKISVLRSISSFFYLSSMQLRQMLGMFKSKHERAEAFIIFYLRIIDMYNSKVFLVRFGGDEERLKLQRRLGYAAFFPFIQPENERFELDLSFHDQRLCCTLLVTLSSHEKAANIREPRYFLGDGTEDPLPQGVPRSWETFEKVPTSGIFSCYYVCAPDDRQFDLRKKLAQTYGYFKTTALEYAVLWWTGLSEPPHDVILFLEFLLRKASSSDKAFNMIDSEGTGIITLRVLEDAVVELGFTKFDGPDKYDRIEVVFRYLDPGMQGSVSRDEWQTVKQLWNEYEHCVSEFVQFLVRTCGEELADAWEALLEVQEADTDQELESLDIQKFEKAVGDLGYFGPTDIVFRMLNCKDDNALTQDEFEKLARYKKNLPTHTKKPMPGRSMRAISRIESMA